MKIFKYGQFVNEADLFTGSSIEGYDSNIIGIAAKTQFCRSLSKLKYWIYKDYGLGFQKAVEGVISKMSDTINFNEDAKYQSPLKLLKKTGRFDEPSDYRFIDKLPDGSYYAKCIDNFKQVLDANGNYDPVNKLNTNYSDLAELIYDIISQEEPSLIISSLKLDEKSFKDVLSNFFKDKDLVTLINKNIPDIRKYVSHNRTMTSIGDAVENFVKEKFESLKTKDGDKAYKCVYQGGDGDPIDMVYGVDLIIGRIGTHDFKLIQVKASSTTAQSASQEPRYSNIDLFCSKLGDKVVVYKKDDLVGKKI
jgi:hypothetical protein